MQYRRYLSGKEPYRDIGKRIGTDRKSILKWVALYEAHGMDGLIKRYTGYTMEFTMDVSTSTERTRDYAKHVAER